MTYAQAIEFLGQTRQFGVKMGLERMHDLARNLGNPHDSLRFIHIAGTNGKGSTAAFCASGLVAHGKSVGLFTSPHLCSIRERITINGAQIDPEDFGRLVGVVAEFTSCDPDKSLTFFEVVTAVALLYFAERQVDWVVWETGLGGRLDATSIVTPELSIITSIGLDHMAYLGETLAQIAREKAGIIKPGKPVVTAVRTPEALEVIQQHTLQLGSPLHQVEACCEIPLGLMGTHQRENAACARMALTLLGLSSEGIHKGLASATWPGRFELLRSDPPFVVDGAHNTQAVEALLDSWKNLYGATTYHLVFGALSDKPYAAMSELLRAQAHKVTLVGVTSERSLPPVALASHFNGLPTSCFTDLEKAWKGLWSLSEPVLLCGSLFLVGQALRLARPESYAVEDFSLNEKLGSPIKKV